MKATCSIFAHFLRLGCSQYCLLKIDNYSHFWKIGCFIFIFKSTYQPYFSAKILPATSNLIGMALPFQSRQTFSWGPCSVPSPCQSRVSKPQPPCPWSDSVPRPPCGWRAPVRGLPGAPPPSFLWPHPAPATAERARWRESWCRWMRSDHQLPGTYQSMKNREH